MNKKGMWGLLGLALVTAWTPVGAVNVDGFDVPYVTLFGSYVLTDSNRPHDNGRGLQATFGSPLPWEHYALEISVYDAMYRRDLDNRRDYQTGLIVDAVRDFGLFGWDNSGMRFKPYALAGVMAIQEDVQGSKNLHPGINAGGGVLWEVPWISGLGLRTEARVQAQNNKRSAPGSSTLVDYRFNIGVQIPFTRYAPARDPQVPPLEDCDIAVVDPVTGRTDCGDERAAPVALWVDSDGDGVPDQHDQCPDTMAGVQVDANGCAMPQPLVLPEFTFEFDSTELSATGRNLLDQMARMLAGQPDLEVEIIGHTDSLGTEAYNLDLSVRRADSARTYLVGKGIDTVRLTATGRGQSQPVATNETEEGRTKNRRAAFWLYVR
jgi:OmpA-OmpF porin, OOP family